MSGNHAGLRMMALQMAGVRVPFRPGKDRGSVVGHRRVHDTEPEMGRCDPLVKRLELKRDLGRFASWMIHGIPPSFPARCRRVE